MVDEGLVVGMRQARAIAHHVRDEASALRHRNIRIAERLDATINLVAGFGDTPLHRPVHGALFLGLASMEGLDRIGIIMAQHTERIGGFAPLLATQMIYRRRIPFHRLARRAAPFPFGNVQDMVAEILEFGIRCLGPFEQVLVVDQEQILPLLRLIGRNERQRVHRDIMVRRPAPMAANYSFEQRHVPSPFPPDSIWIRREMPNDSYAIINHSRARGSFCCAYRTAKSVGSALLPFASFSPLAWPCLPGPMKPKR